MAEQGNSDAELVLPAVFIGVLFAVWVFIPQVISVPMYYIRLSQSWVTAQIPIFGLAETGQYLLSVLGDVDPMKSESRDWIVSAYENRIFFGWDILLGLFMVFGSMRFKNKLSKVAPPGSGIDIEWLIRGVAQRDFPHLRPFVNFNPLNRPEKEGLWRMPDTMIDHIKRYDLMPLCTGCGLMIYEWNDGTVDCESHHEKRNLQQGAKDRFCRTKKDKDTKFYFRTELSKKVFFKQVTRMGLMPKDPADIPRALWNHSPMSYMIVALCYARLEAPGFKDQKDADKIVADMSNMVKGFTKKDGRGVYNKQMVMLAKKNAQRFMTKEIIEKYDEPLLRHGYLCTFVMGVFDYTHIEKGVLPTSLFAYLRGFDRPLFFALNVIGSPSPFVEAWGAFYHYKAEVTVDRPLVGPEAVAISRQYEEAFRKAVDPDFDDIS